MASADFASPDRTARTGSPYAIDHVFMLVEPGGAETMAKLAKGGLTQSWSRKHVGMGTANIFVCFDNAFLELVWIENEAEALSGPVGKRLVERNNKRNIGAMPYGLAIRAPSMDHVMPFEGWRFTPPSVSDMKNTVMIANSSDDPAQPFLFRSQRSVPPKEWTDELAGKRQVPGGFGSITSWRLDLPKGVAPGKDLQKLQELGLLTLGETSGPTAAWTVTASRLDGGEPRRFRLPDCTWED
ncbi:MAG: VOC family protein [Rhodospirillaceae bacterium]|nr:VOC family protein [Rhodospirillaceae bacterium]